MAGSRMGLSSRLIAAFTAILGVFLAMPAVASAEGQIIVVVAGPGAGRVVGDGQGAAPIDCPAACSSLSGISRVITLTAIPDADSMLGGWTVDPGTTIVSGCGTSPTCTVSVGSAIDSFVPGPGGGLIVIPHTTVVNVRATFVRRPDGIFLCYSKFQLDPGVWPATEAPALVAGGYWQPDAILGARSSTRLGPYALVCNPPASAVVSAREAVDSGGGVITEAHGLGLYPVARL